MNTELFLRGVRLAKEQCPAEKRDGYAFRLPAVRALRKGVEFTQPVTFFMGENGTGKSTLLEAVAAAWGFNPEGGSLNFHFSTAETHSGLHCSLVLRRGARRPRDGYFLRAESFYNVATEIDRLDLIPAMSPLLKDAYGGRSLHEQSHGESFFALIANRFGGNGLYILDEPEAALSAVRQLAMLTAIHELVKKGSQFLISTHSPLLSAYPRAEILVLDGHGLTPTPYEQTEPYLLTKRFLNAPDRMLRELLEEPAKDGGDGRDRRTESLD